MMMMLALGNRVYIHRPTEQILLGYFWDQILLGYRFVPGGGSDLAPGLTPPWYKTITKQNLLSWTMKLPWYK